MVWKLLACSLVAAYNLTDSNQSKQVNSWKSLIARRKCTYGKLQVVKKELWKRFEKRTWKEPLHLQNLNRKVTKASTLLCLTEKQHNYNQRKLVHGQESIACSKQELWKEWKKNKIFLPSIIKYFLSRLFTSIQFTVLDLQQAEHLHKPGIILVSFLFPGFHLLSFEIINPTPCIIPLSLRILLVSWFWLKAPFIY